MLPLSIISFELWSELNDGLAAHTSHGLHCFEINGETAKDAEEWDDEALEKSASRISEVESKESAVQRRSDSEADEAKDERSSTLLMSVTQVSEMERSQRDVPQNGSAAQ